MLHKWIEKNSQTSGINPLTLATLVVYLCIRNDTCAHNVYYDKNSNTVCYMIQQLKWHHGTSINNPSHRFYSEVM